MLTYASRDMEPCTQDMAACGRCRTKDLVLGYMAAFAAGDAESRVRGRAVVGWAHSAGIPH